MNQIYRAFSGRKKNHGAEGRCCRLRVKGREKQLPLIQRCLVNIDLMAFYTEKNE